MQWPPRSARRPFFWNFPTRFPQYMNDVNSGTDDDNRLVRRLRQGDEDAFAVLFAKHHAAVYRYALQMCGPSGAEDVVQEVFLALLRQTDRYDPGRGAVLTYLYGIARHHVLKRLSAVGVESALDEDEVDHAAVPATALDDLSRAETVDLVRQAVQFTAAGISRGRRAV